MSVLEDVMMNEVHAFETDEYHDSGGSGNGIHAGTGRHANDVAVNTAMILDMLVDLQTCIDVSAGRADGDMNVLILVGIEEVLNLVSGGTALASPPVEGNTDFAGNDKLIFHCLLLQIQRQR